jgi:hypothetical protein
MAMVRKRVPKGKRYPLNMRTTRELRDRIEAAAHASGRSLVQEVEYRLEQSFQEEELMVVLDDTVIDDYTNDSYGGMMVIGETALFTREYVRKRREGGHPLLPTHVVRALYRAAKRAKVTPEQYWKRKLKECGVLDPDAPYEPPAEQAEQDEK